MIEVRPKGPFSRTYLVVVDGRSVELESSWTGERATFELDGRYVLGREGLLSGPFRLEVEATGEIVAEATRPSGSASGLELTIVGGSYGLRQISPWRRDFELVVDERRVGLIQPGSAWSRTPTVDLPPDWPAESRIFVVWLVLVIWSRMATM